MHNHPTNLDKLVGYGCPLISEASLNYEGRRRITTAVQARNTYGPLDFDILMTKFSLAFAHAVWYRESAPHRPLWYSQSIERAGTLHNTEEEKPA